MHQRLKHALKEKREKREVDGVDELCDRLAALHFDNNALAAASPETDHTLPAGVRSDVNTVKHHWAPRFRPNSLPTPIPKLTLTPLIEKLATSLSQKSTLDEGLSADVRPSTRELSPKFPPSAFLQDLASLIDCAGHWPLENPTPEPSPFQKLERSRQPAPLLLTTKFSAGNLEPASQSSNTASPQGNAVEPQRAVPTILSLSTNAAPAFKRFAALGVSPFTPSPRSDLTTSRPLTPPLTLVPPILSNPSYPQTPLVPMLAILASTTPTSQRSAGGWLEASQGITVFAPSPKAFITALVTSPYLFVYPSQPWAPLAVFKNVFNETAIVPRRLRSKFTFTPDLPGRRIGQEEFLAMGHDPECWCDRQKKSREARDLGDKAGPSERAFTYGSSAPSHSWNDIRAAEPGAALTARRSARVSTPLGFGLTFERCIPKMKAKPGTMSPASDMNYSQVPVAPVLVAAVPGASLETSPVVTPKITHVSYAVPDLEYDTESTSSDEVAVMVTPTSEGSDLGFQRLITPSTESAYLDFEGLEVIEGVPFDLDSDWSDGWTSVSNGSPSQQPSSTPTTQIVPNAVEWPTLRKAMAVKPTREEPSREYDDEWDSRVWDGATDWFP